MTPKRTLDTDTETAFTSAVKQRYKQTKVQGKDAKTDEDHSTEATQLIGSEMEA